MSDSGRQVASGDQSGSGLVDREGLAVLREPSFRSYAISRTSAATAQTLFQAAVAWQVYVASGSTVQLGLLGIVRLVPALGLLLVSGAVVDVYDRRKILLLAQVAPLVASVIVLGLTVTDQISLPVLYVLVFVTGAAAAFDSPARQSLLPALVPAPMYRSAITVTQTFQAFAFVTGPALAGVLIAWQGAGLAYLAYALLMAVAVISLITMPAPAERVAGARRVSIGAMREGLSFVWHNHLLLAAMTLDLFAVIFGGAKALLPVYALDILHVGPSGYGILSASYEAGSLLSALALVVLPKPSRTGRAILITVAVFGVATVLFGVSPVFPLSVLAYAAVGMADQVSVVLRSTTIQLNTPDALRGRVSAVNTAFTNTSNQLGAVESGFVAAVTGAPFAVVSGGLACLAIVGAVAWLIPEMRTYRAEDHPPARV